MNEEDNEEHEEDQHAGDQANQRCNLEGAFEEIQVLLADDVIGADGEDQESGHWQAIGQGMRTLRMVALDRVREGVSTLEQVLILTAAH